MTNRDRMQRYPCCNLQLIFADSSPYNLFDWTIQAGLQRILTLQTLCTGLRLFLRVFPYLIFLQTSVALGSEQ